MSAVTLPLNIFPSSTFARNLKIFIRETRYEFVRGLRTKTYSFAVIGFPVMFYALFGILMNRDGHIGGIAVSRYLLGGYAVFGAISAALFGVGVGLAGELHAGWLELKRASPMPPLAYLLAKCTMAMCFGVMIVCILTCIGLTFGHLSITPIVFVKMVGLTALGTVSFASFALLLSLILPANSAPGVTNLINLPMSFLGGLWLPVDFLPKALQHIAPFIPTYQLGQLMLGTLGYASHGSTLNHWMNLAAFSMISLGCAWGIFRRRELDC